jgi:hypothetical protein
MDAMEAGARWIPAPAWPREMVVATASVGQAPHRQLCCGHTDAGEGAEASSARSRRAVIPVFLPVSRPRRLQAMVERAPTWWNRARRTARRVSADCPHATKHWRQEEGVFQTGSLRVL